uniref:Cytochrome P450 n=1 Tax=Scoparia dulcis TaxID=107240 RepID=A0A7G1L1L8_SCODU|nr:cytochrome P450 [Scoparia dulcis]
MELPSWILLVSFFIFAFTFRKILNSIRKSNHNLTVKLPPGPRKMPLIGHLHLFTSTDPPHRIFRNLAIKFGPFMHLQLGEISTIIISSPEVANEFFKTCDINFAYRPSYVTAEIFSYGNIDISFAPYGEYWRGLRKICTLELLSMKRVQSFRLIREEEFLNLCKWIASREGTLIDLTERVQMTVYDVITRACLGKKRGDQAAFVSMIEQTLKMISGLEIENMYPSIKIFHLMSGLTRRAKKLFQEIDSILSEIIKEHQTDINAARSTSTDQDEQFEDFVDILLKSEQSLSTDSIKSVLMDVFVAGTDTASLVVDWAMAELLKNPRSMKKAKDEVRQVYDKQGYVDESYLHELKYLKLVIKETLRLHPPAPLLGPRENRESCVFHGYALPPKTRVLVNAWAIGRDPRHWKEAESFIPERFLDNSIDFKGNNFEYIPFGAGRRMCPGMSFGLANVELALAMLLYHFDWNLPLGQNPEEMDMKDTSGTVATRSEPLHVIPVVTKPLP